MCVDSEIFMRPSHEKIPVTLSLNSISTPVFHNDTRALREKKNLSAETVLYNSEF
jgi:ribosomal protein L30/L7E